MSSALTWLNDLALCGQMLPVESDTALVPKVGMCVLNVQFSIADVSLAVTRVLHFQALIGNRAQSLVARHWQGVTERNAFDAVIKAAESELRAEMTDYGVCVNSLDAAGFGLGVVMKSVSDWSYADQVNGKRPE
jgi:hypothetical protein